MKALFKRMVGTLTKAAGFTAAVIAFTPAMFATAAPLSPQIIPASTTWLVHADFDALAKTSLWHTVQHTLKHNRRLQAAINEIQLITGTDITTDLNDVTLFGSSFSPGAPVLVLHGTTDKAKLINALKLNAHYSKCTFGAYTIRSWQSKGQPMFGAYYDAKTIVIAHSQSALETELNMLNGKGPALQESSALMSGLHEGLMVYVSGKDLWKLHLTGKAQSPLLACLRAACIGIGEHENNLDIRALLTAKTRRDAMLMQTSLDGLRSMAELAAQNNADGSKARLVGEAVTSVSTQVRGRTLRVDWPIAFDLVRQAVNLTMHPGGSPAEQSSGK
ncbi:MAG: hypothetical protein HKL96_09910 [Phycisphaerales bacterium]|nr:hypothetical protein [Phycisphaerales bacterium]